MFFHLSLAHGIYYLCWFFFSLKSHHYKMKIAKKWAWNSIPCECIQTIDQLKFAEFENSFQLPFYQTIHQICWFFLCYSFWSLENAPYFEWSAFDANNHRYNWYSDLCAQINGLIKYIHSAAIRKVSRQFMNSNAN